jgi:hypothetical protein
MNYHTYAEDCVQVPRVQWEQLKSRNAKLEAFLSAFHRRELDNSNQTYRDLIAAIAACEEGKP